MARYDEADVAARAVPIREVRCPTCGAEVEPEFGPDTSRFKAEPAPGETSRVRCTAGHLWTIIGMQKTPEGLRVALGDYVGQEPMS